MLLFFIAQMAALAGECTSKNINQINIDYTVNICESDPDLIREVTNAVSYWNRKGESIVLNKDINNCNYHDEFGSIYIEYNDYEVSLESNKDFTAHAVTDRSFGKAIGAVLYSTVFLSTKMNEDQLSKIVRHEIGHALGYNHISHSCYGYALHPHTSKMGLKF